MKRLKSRLDRHTHFRARPIAEGHPLLHAAGKGPIHLAARTIIDYVDEIALKPPVCQQAWRLRWHSICPSLDLSHTTSYIPDAHIVEDAVEEIRDRPVGAFLTSPDI